MDDGKPKLLDRLRQQIRVRNYSIRIEAVYAEWAKCNLRFQCYRQTAELGSASAGMHLPHRGSGAWHTTSILCPSGSRTNAP